MSDVASILGVLSPSEYAALSLRALYAGRGYKPYRMSKFEEYDLYSVNKDFLVSSSVITFTDTDGRLMALKPDVTLSIIKNTADVKTGLNRIYYNENVYRVAKGTNSFKEIPQAGVECIGSIDRSTLTEVLNLAVESLQTITSEFVLEVSSLDVVNAVCKGLGLSDRATAEVFACLAAKNVGGLTSLAKACDLDENKTRALLGLAKVNGLVREVEGALNALIIDDESRAVIDEFKAVIARIDEDKKDSVSVDFSVVNDRAYYNGIAFRGFVYGVATRVLSGGQYDKLMKKLGKSSCAIGFAVYLDEIGRVGGKYEQNA